MPLSSHGKSSRKRPRKRTSSEGEPNQTLLQKQDIQRPLAVGVRTGTDVDFSGFLGNVNPVGNGGLIRNNVGIIANKGELVVNNVNLTSSNIGLVGNNAVGLIVSNFVVGNNGLTGSNPGNDAGLVGNGENTVGLTGSSPGNDAGLVRNGDNNVGPVETNGGYDSLARNVAFGVTVGRMDPYTPLLEVASPSTTSSTAASASVSATSADNKPLESSESSSDSLLSLFKSFRLNQEQRPLKIVRASYQYLYDNANAEYLDCVNSVSHVGHCHPVVVKAASATMECNITTQGWDIDYGDIRYPVKLRQTLPDYLDTFLFCNSGSEAVDLSLQLCQLYTRGTDVVVIDNAFHGSIDSVHHLSPKVFKANNISKADWVHIVAMPDLYRGQDPGAVDKYISDAREVVQNIRHTGKKIACFIAEPMLTVPGIIIPPSTWVQEIYKMVHEAGGLCIADEVQAGLGRIGSHFWSFQALDVNPDILIIGKTIGNGYPMASVVTSREIAAVLGDRIKEYKCSPLMDAVGCAVLEVLEKEHLMAAAASVGSFLQDQLKTLQHQHEYIGDVRGKGLMVALEIVWSKESKKPAQEVAEQIVHRMKDEYVILANEGCNRNILMLMPPMCFTKDNAISLVQRLEKVLSELPKHRHSQDDTAHLSPMPQASQSTVCEGRLGIIQPQEEEDDDGEDDSSSSNKDTMDLEYTQHSYQDLD